MDNHESFVIFIERLKKFLFNSWLKSKKEWDRILPFGEYISDRWVKAKQLGFGFDSSIYDSSLVFGNVKVGKNTWIGPFTILDGTGGLIIGDNCSISAGVQIYSHDNVEKTIFGNAKNIRYSQTIIGDNTYIGPNTIVQKGVVIGSRVIIGANSFVNKSIESGVKAWGSPIKVVGPVDNEGINVRENI